MIIAMTFEHHLKKVNLKNKGGHEKKANHQSVGLFMIGEISNIGRSNKITSNILVELKFLS